MPFLYSQVQFECALRTGQIIGTSQSTLEAAYTGNWSAALDGAEIPISSFKTNLLNCEREIAHIIGSDQQHPYRSMLYGRSANIANLGSSPTVDNNGYEFVGVFDAVRDADNLHLMTFQPSQTIDDISDAFFSDIQIYNYNLSGNYVQFPPTTDNVFFEGCVWDYDVQSAAYDNAGSSPLPQMAANTMIAAYMATTAQIGWVDASGTQVNYNQLYQQGIAILKARGDGKLNLPLVSQNAVAG